LEFVTTAVFDLLVVFVVEVFVVELFVVVFAALPQAEKSSASEAMIRVEEVVTLKSLVFPF
jgi:hypothetical protein